MRDLIARLAAWLLNPRCPWCGQRCQNIEAHFHIDHAGLPEQP